MASRQHVQGLRTTIASMRKVAALVGPAMNEASKRSLEPTLALSKANVPVRSGRLKRALILRRAKDSAKTRPVYLIGADPKSPARRFAHIIEFGRAPNASGKGAITGRRFMSRAFQSTKVSALQIWGKTFSPALEKSAARIAARQAKGRP